MCDVKDVAYITVTNPYITTTSVPCTENFSVLSSVSFGSVLQLQSLPDTQSEHS